MQMNDMKKSYEKEVAKLNDKIDYLLQCEEKFFYLKGRFIYKSFCDFIFLIFDINVEIKIEDKKALLEQFAIKKNVNLEKIKLIIEEIRKVYCQQTQESHWRPTEKEIKEYILALYDDKKGEQDLLKQFFESSAPETEIIELIKKNDDLTLVNNSNKEIKVKEKEKSKINSEINNMLGVERKERLLEILLDIFGFK